MSKFSIFFALPLILASLPALAQVASPSSASSAPGSTLSVMFNLAQPAPDGDDVKPAVREKRIRDAVLSLVDKECSVLLATIATKCETQSLNVNVNLRQGFYPNFGFPASRGPIMSAAANATFAVDLKSDLQPAAQPPAQTP